MKGLRFFWQERDWDVWQKYWTVHQQFPRSSHRILILAITLLTPLPNGASQTCLPCNIFNVTSITCPYRNLPYTLVRNNGISIWYNLDNLSFSLIFDWAEWYPGKEICNKCCVKYYCWLIWYRHLRSSMETCHVKVFYRLCI